MFLYRNINGKETRSVQESPDNDLFLKVSSPGKKDISQFGHNYFVRRFYSYNSKEYPSLIMQETGR
jgi:hypothetical protein